MDENVLLSVAEAAEMLNVSTGAIHKWIDQGHFPNAFKLNPRLKNSPYRIPKDDVENLQLERTGGKDNV